MSPSVYFKRTFNATIKINDTINGTITVPRLGPVSYEYLGTLSAEQLNEELTANVVIANEKGDKTNIYNLFNETVNSRQAAVPFANNIGAKNPVSFYRLIYSTQIPENNKIYKVSGLLALPILSPGQSLINKSKLPLLSWQHGTILTSNDAPSEMVRNGKIVRSPFGVPSSAETLFNTVRFAGNGYAMAAADYIGNGISTETQAYAVKGATIQTTRDMITSAKAVINTLTQSNPLITGFLIPNRQEAVGDLFLNGWSQGGLNTQWLGSSLQQDKIIVKKQAQSAAPTDFLTLTSYWLNNYPGSPDWLTGCVPLLFGAYEKYYGIENLMSQAIKPEYLEISKDIYNKTADWSKAGPPKDLGLFGLPLTPKEMLNEEFLDEFNAGTGKFYSQIKAESTLELKYAWPTRFYGGSGDNIVPTNISINAPVIFQQSLGSDLSTGLNMGTIATHRSTFLGSIFDSQLNPGNSIFDWFKT